MQNKTKISPKDLVLRSFKITREQDEGLAYQALEMNITKSELVRRCILKAMPEISKESMNAIRERNRIEKAERDLDLGS